MPRELRAGSGYETELAHEVADGDARADLGTVLRVLGFDELGQAPGFRERDAQGALGVSAVVFALGLVALGARQDHYARGRAGRLGKRGGDFAPADLRLAVAGILHAVQEVVCRDVIDLDLEAVDGPLPAEKAGRSRPLAISRSRASSWLPISWNTALSLPVQRASLARLARPQASCLARALTGSLSQSACLGSSMDALRWVS